LDKDKLIFICPIELPFESTLNMSDTALECIITLVEGKGFMVDNYTGHTDPHVIFQLGGNEYTSKTKTQTLNPTWNETFSFKGNFKDNDSFL
jgi:Ca2+-dependent lipid-binding protein